MLLGAHLSVSGGVDTAFKRAVDLECTAFQIFTKSNRQWQAKDLLEEEIERYHQLQKDSGITPVVCHASYLLNLGTPEDSIWQKSIEALVIELQRCEILKIPYLVVHPGSHVKTGIEAGLARLQNHPMLILWGARDFVFTVKDFLVQWQRYFPQAETHIFPDAGHYVVEDAHERIIPLIEKFMAD